MVVATVLLVLGAAVALALRPIGGPASRWLALVVAVAFGVAALDAPVPQWRTVPARSAHADLAGTATGAVLAAAAAAGPRATDLVLAWRGPLGDLAPGPVGAAVALPVAPLPWQPQALQVRALRPPCVGRPAVLELGIEDPAAACTAAVLLQCGGRDVLRERVRLDGGRRVEVAFTPAEAGLHTLLVDVEIAGHALRCSGVLSVANAPTVLVHEPSGLAAAALRAQGVAVVEVAPGGLPADWRQHAAVVLGQPLPVAAQSELAAAVHDGLGLFVLAPGLPAVGEPLRTVVPVQPMPLAAAPAASGAAAGEQTAAPAEPVTPPPPSPPPPSVAGPDRPPVSSEPIEVDKRAIAMVLVVDRSGSMGELVVPGRTKMSYGKTSALQTANALTEGDAVGIVTFGNKGAGRMELPLTPAEDLAAVRAGVERLAHAAEQTYLLSGLQVAEQMLAGSAAAVKHVVVITDGQFNLSEKVALRKVAHGLRTEHRVTVSVISIVKAGDADQEFRKEAELLTQDGGGQFLPTEDPTTVPVFVSSEVTRALSRVGRKPGGGGVAGATSDAPRPAPAPVPPPTPKEPTPPPPAAQRTPAAPARLAVRAVAASPLLAPEPTADWPTLGAATPNTAPLDAQVLLAAGSAGWPLLAFGNRGLGRAGAFAADLFGVAGEEFRREPAFPARFSRWVAALQSPEAARVPVPLLTAVAVTPPAPTPREVRALAGLGGGPPVLAAALPASAPAPERAVQHLGAPWSLFALLGIVLLALVERLSAARFPRSAV